VQHIARKDYGGLEVEGVHGELWDYPHLSETDKNSLWSMETDSGRCDVLAFRCLVQRLVERLD
jgi:hypothetical protein